ncbi:lipoprotein signal peptidase [Taibaiella soli]|uniref:Lipoprotein signal peptidase n=1 Tax=Taibaiella soli TaxID=1649169 RepID=A0A2W2B6A0_9BACT|nr:lipoprotein signal peptidase [Taibaiella soli]PZF71507.1 lipoprotein signal peptidase [Taibaiella soli]
MKYRHAILIVFLVILIDQIFKIYVKTHFYYGEEVNVLGHWFRLHFLENEGMAFGMKFSQAAFGKLLLTSFRLIAVAFGFYLLKRVVNRGYGNGAIICGALILAGAMGNLIDSLFYGLIFTESSFHVAQIVPMGQGYGQFLHGRVVDMFYFPIINVNLPSWIPIWGGKEFEFFEPVFNFADAAISVGVLTLVFFQKKLVVKKHKTPAKQAAV